MKERETVEKIVSDGLCTGCGTCVGICPQGAIKMIEIPSGFLIPSIDSKDCANCGLCIKICPGSHLQRELISESIDPFTGPVLSAYCGYALDANIRKNAQSGGIVTALLCHMLNSGQVDQAVVVQMPEDGTLRPKSIIVNNMQELMKAQGSKYCPVAVNASLPKKSAKKYTALVGLPCQIQGLSNAQFFNQDWREYISFKIGLFCDRMLAYGSIDYLINKSVLPKKEIVTFRYKDKSLGGYPGNVSIRSKDGRTHSVHGQHRIACKDAFTSLRCRLCFDKLNILSDLSVGDAWGVMEDKEGFSVIAVRTEKADNILKSAERAKILYLNEINPDAIFKGQAIEARRVAWTAYNYILGEKNICVPDFGIDDRWYAKLENIDLDKYHQQVHWAQSMAKKRTSKGVLRATKSRIKKSERAKKRLLRKIASFIRRIGRKIMNLFHDF